MATQKEYDKFEKEFKTIENSFPELIKNFGRMRNACKLLSDYYVDISVWMKVVVDDVDSVEEMEAEELEKLTQEIIFLREILIPKYKALITASKEFEELINSREV